MKTEISRRSFLKGSAVAAAAVAAAGSLPVMAEEEAVASEGKLSFEIPPEPVPDDQIAETYEADIIVIGAGVSGLCCACSATEAYVAAGFDPAKDDPKVILFAAGTKHVERGGSNHGIDTKTQAEFGIDYKKESLAKRIKQEYVANGYTIDQRKWSKWINNNTESMNWLIDKMESYGAHVTLELPYADRDGLFDFKAASHNFTFIPEEGKEYIFHSMFGGSVTMGAAFGQGLVNDMYEYEILKNGGRIDYNTRALYLIREDNNTGRVSAVVAENAEGKFVKYVGRKAIVMATGDFSANHEMMQKYAPQAMEILAPEPQPNFDRYKFGYNYDAGFQFGGLYPGDGHKMGLWVGAAWQKTFPNAAMVDNLNGPYSNGISNVTTINLNQDGKRFMNEDTMCAYSAWALKQQKNMTCYYILNADYAKHYDTWYTFGCTLGGDGGINGPAGVSSENKLADWERQAARNAETPAERLAGQYIKADTLQELFERWGDIDVEQALKTMEEYNQYCEDGYDPEFMKSPEELVPIKEGPFFGFKYVLNSANFLCITGGLRTNEEMQVCDADDNPIEGLYNVGIMTGDMYGVCYNFCICGHNLSCTCNTFPYMLGRKLAAE